MSSENNHLLPNEDDTQSLNKIVADIRVLTNDINVIKAELAKRTNPDMLSAFAQIIKDALAQQKVEFDETLRTALAQQKVEFEIALAQQKVEFEIALAQQKVEFDETLRIALAQQKAEFSEMLRTEINNLRLEISQEFKQVRNEIKSIERRFHLIFKNMGDEAMRTDEIEDRVEQLEKKLAS